MIDSVKTLQPSKIKSLISEILFLEQEIAGLRREEEEQAEDQDNAARKAEVGRLLSLAITDLQSSQNWLQRAQREVAWLREEQRYP